MPSESQASINTIRERKMTWSNNSNRGPRMTGRKKNDQATQVNKIMKFDQVGRIP
jgi:hypothetical protein